MSHTLNEENSSESSDSDISCLESDLTKLQPYDFEPLVSDNQESSSDTDSDDIPSTNEALRVGNIDWCECGNCRPMETESESLCCIEANEIPDEFFQGTK